MEKSIDLEAVELSHANRMKANQRILLACVAAVVVIAGFLFWFNRYSFTVMKIGDSTFPVRTSRFTGKSEVFLMGQWTRMGAPASGSAQSTNDFEFTPEDLRKLEAKAGIRTEEFVTVGELPKQLFNCSIYNGTTHALRQLTIRLIVLGPNGQTETARQYVLKTKDGNAVPPWSNGNLEAEIGLNPEPGKWNWAIIAAKGVQ